MNLSVVVFVYVNERGVRCMDEYIAVYGKRLYGLCVTLCASQYDADDLYQETWLRAFSRFSTYDTSMPFEPWITRICVNIFRDVLRRRKRERICDADDNYDISESVSDSRQEDMRHIRDAVDRLPEKLRTAVILFYFHDMSEKQTAEALGIPVGTVKSRLSKAKKLLREELGDAEFI